MERLASKMSDWIDLDIIAEYLEIPKKNKPKTP